MVDLTEHLRKAGKVKTEKKTAASRATIAEARKVKALRARYVAALDNAFDAWMSDDSELKATAIKAVMNLRGELGGKR